MSFQQINFHKKTFFPSSSKALEFNIFNSNQIYFSSGNKLVLYDFIENKKIFRINVRGKTIISFTQCLNDNDSIYILDLENVIYKFKISSKEVECEYQLNKNRKYTEFKVINDKYFYFLSQNDSYLTKIELSLNENGEYIFNLNTEYKINEITQQKLISLKEKETNNQIIYKKKNLCINEDTLLCSYGNLLLIHNLISKSTTQIQFQKTITKISFINEDSVCLGDISGKIHFITNFTDKNYIISTKHWHSHKINDLVIDPNSEYLYSCGMEGVIVIWNINTWVKNFLPRLNDVIITMKVSNDSKYLSCYLNNNSIKIINLSEMKVIDELSSIPYDSFINKFVLFQNKQHFITFSNENSGNIQFYNIGSNTFPFSLNVFNKNFISKTEREKDNNMKKLKKIAFSSIKNDDICYMITLEELYFDIDNLLTSYLMFWKVGKENIELIEICENPHLNEKVEFIEGSNYTFKFVTVSNSHFKIWELNNEKNKFTCSYMGKYKNQKVISVDINNNLIGNKYFVLFNNFMIMYDKDKIKKIFALYENKNYKKIIYLNSKYICIICDNCLIIIDIDNWCIQIEEKIENAKIIKINFQSKENIINVFFSKNENKNIVYLLKYSMALVSDNKLILESALLLEKKNYKFVDFYKKFIIMINNKNDFFIASEKEIREQINKKEMDEYDIELK